MGCTDTAICPVRAFVHYIGVRTAAHGSLFVLQSGDTLTRSYLVTQLQAALRKAGLNNTLFNGHSFRIGIATMAAMQGLEDSLIQTLGRWQSDAYNTYIKIPQMQHLQTSG